MADESKDVTLDTQVVRAEGALSAEMGADIVMLVPERNAYFDTNQQGAAIWNLLDRPTTARDISTRLLQRFDVSEAECQRDVLAFVRLGVTEGLIRTA